MFAIRNAQVGIYNHDKTISYIVAKMEDQDYETLMALGRGRMYGSAPCMMLKYELPENVTVMLKCD